MRHLLTFAVLVALVCSCATQKNLPSVVTAQDSVRTEIRTEIVERIDTVFVSLPPQKSERTTTDTTSTLENDYAKSTASILPNGLLFHNLETKPHPLPVPVKNTTERRDSILERKVEIPVPYPVEVEVNRLTWFQQAQIYGCRILVALFALGAVIRYRKSILVLIRRLL